MIRAIHVDKDGTFSLSEPRNKRVIEDLAAEEGVYSDMDSDARHALWRKNLWGMCEGRAEQAIHSILAQKFPESTISKVKPSDFELACKTLYNERHHEVTIRDGMIDALRLYKDKGALLAMVTSSDRKSTDMDLEMAFGKVSTGEDFFDVIITSDDVPNPLDRKPSPVPFLKSCDALNLSAEWGHVALEDSPTGSESAISCFGQGNNLVVRFLEESNSSMNEHDHDRLVHAYTMEEASKLIKTFNESPLSERRLNDNDPVAPFNDTVAPHRQNNIG